MTKEIFEKPINVKDYPVHSTIARIVLELPVSEASVERAFSLKAGTQPYASNLGCKTVKLFFLVWYNFEALMKMPSIDHQIDEIIRGG